MNLKPHQQKTVQEAKDKWGLWFKMRVGKTPTAIKLADERCKTCLVIVPKSLKEQWENEIKLWSDGRCQFTVITKETFRRDFGKIDRFEAIIWDEVHLAGCNYKTQLFKAALKYITHYDIKYVWILTGTPWTSSPWAVYSYHLLLGIRLSWPAFSNRFFYQLRMGSRTIPKPRTDRDDELQYMLCQIGTVIDLKDVSEVAEDYDIEEYFDLNKEQEKAIGNITDIMPIVKFGKQHQLESGSLKSDGYSETILIDCDKDKRIKEICEDNDKTVIVVRYLAIIDKYRKMLAGLGKEIFVISGQEQEAAAMVAQKAEQSDKAIVIIQSDTVAGYSLKSFSTMVFASLSYSFVNYDQVRSRIKAMEKNIGNTYIHLLTRGNSIDKAIYDCVKRKENFSIELYAKE